MFDYYYNNMEYIYFALAKSLWRPFFLGHGSGELLLLLVSAAVAGGDV